MKRALLLIALLISLNPVSVRADLVEEDPTYPDNTGVLSTEGSVSDIVSDDQNSQLGTKQGEITLMKLDGGVDVYSGLKKVERIQGGADGWTGTIEEATGMFHFQPAGRPMLECPSQSLTNWYGPCKIPDAQSE